MGFVSIFPDSDDNIRLRLYDEKVTGSHAVLLCSLQECSTVETKAAPGTLVAIKRKLNRVVLQHYDERSGPPSLA